MRKGQAEFMEWLPRLIMMLIAMIIIVILVRHFTDRGLDDQRLHMAALESRIYYDDLIMYSDGETKRVYPGVVDVSKFDSFDSSIFKEGELTAKVGARMTVKDDGGCSVTAKPRYVFGNSFNLYYSFAETGSLGAQSGVSRTELWPVTFKKDNKECPGLLEVVLVRSNS